MDPLVAGSLAFQAGTGVLKLGKSVVQGIKANNMLKNLKRPEYEIQQGIKDNQNLAESRAQQGMSDDARRINEQSIERNGMSALDAITRSGGNLNNIGDLFAGIADGSNRMAMLDEEMRVRNMTALMQQNERMAAEQEKAWQINTWAPYADKVQSAAALKSDASQNFSGGIDTLGQAASNMATAAMYEKEGNNVFGKKQGEMNWRAVPTMVAGPSTSRNAPQVGAINIDMSGRQGSANIDPALAVREKFPGLTGFNPFNRR